MSLVSSIVKSFVKNIGNFAGGFVGVPIAGDIVVDAWGYWQNETDDRQRKEELERYARLRVDEGVAEIVADVRRDASHLVAEQRGAIISYLSQLPAAIRRSLRRPADQSGTTVPAGLALRSANDLLQFLPPKLPRFKPGDRPLPTTDLELVELLGQGGFGEVWKARHLDRPKLPPVALKFCLDSAAARSLERERDLLDQVASAGKQEGIVQLLNTHLRANPPCLEYECVEGGDLTGVFAELHAKGVPAPELVAKIVLNLASIVAFAHSQSPSIVHRDLKPANILVRRRNGKLAFKIADFGIGGLWAKEALDKERTGQTKPSERQLDTVLGAYTPLYASPEQIAGKHPDPRDDVHALGIIWYQLQTDQLALRNLPSHWRDDLVEAGVPRPLLDVLAASIGKLTGRPKDAGDLAERLASILGRNSINVLFVIITPGGSAAENAIAVVPHDKVAGVDLALIDGVMLNADDMTTSVADEIVRLYKRFGLERQEPMSKKELALQHNRNPDFVEPPMVPVDLSEYVNPKPPFVVHKVVRIGWEV